MFFLNSCSAALFGSFCWVYQIYSQKLQPEPADVIFKLREIEVMDIIDKESLDAAQTALSSNPSPLALRKKLLHY